MAHPRQPAQSVDPANNEAKSIRPKIPICTVDSPFSDLLINRKTLATTRDPLMLFLQHWKRRHERESQQPVVGQPIHGDHSYRQKMS